jgi:outer membrane receptor protein involved in Fe transport
MLRNREGAHDVRRALVLTLFISAAFNSTAWAQQDAPQPTTQPPAQVAQATPAPATEATQPAPELATVTVTGTRIATPNATSTSPIQVVTAHDIALSGKTDVSELMYQLPQNFNNALGQDLSNRTSGLTTAGGVTTADLRGLGPQRTLVLIDGRRLGQGDANTAIASPAPDLDQIPLQLVERVDVVTGGASAVYGSDAIAGVINFILKKNFEGIQVDGQWGEDWHSNHNTYAQGLATDFGVTPPTGSVNDGRSRSFNIIVGTNFADGKGNITAYFNYLHQDPVLSGSRDFGACQMTANSTLPSGVIDSLVCTGSPNSNQFIPQGIIPAGGTFAINVLAPLGNVGNQLLPWPADGQVPPALFNSQQYIYIQRQDQRYMAGFMAHLDMHDWLQPYAEFGFMNDRTHQQIAPTALFENSNPNDIANTLNYNVNCSNPLLSAQEYTAIGCTAPTDIANISIGRRNAEGAGRSSDFEHMNYRAVLGAKGTFADAWTYDAYGQYYYTTLFNSNNDYFNYANIDNALMVTIDPKTGQPACISGPPCVPYNIFQQGGVTQAALNYLYLNGTAYGTVTERILHADVTGELGKYGLQLPTARDGLAVNLGYEHRSDQVVFAPDSGELSGQLAGFGGAPSAINNGISVSEGFIELRAPLIQDKAFAQDLVFDAGYRYSNYSSIGGVNTYKGEIQWAPVRDIRFRGSYNRAIRAPSIIELYNPQLVGQVQIGEDPCAPSSKAGANFGKATATLAQCMNTGATAAQYGNGIGPILGGTDFIPQGAASQLAQLQGGNTKLQAETADTYTLGANFTPEFLPTFNGSIDYYHIKLTNGVGSIPASIVLNNCLATGDPTYCSLIVRSATGGLQGASVASGGYIIQTNLNVGEQVVEGVDVQLAYKLPLTNLGAFTFTLAGTVNLGNTTTPYPGAIAYDCAGLYGASCQTVNPRWRHNARIAWDTPWWSTEFFVNWRYLDAVMLDNNSNNPTLNVAEYGVYDQYNRRIPSFSYIDIGFTWQVLKELQLRGGINNLLDKDPPLVAQEISEGGGANTYSVYDTLGRQLFIGFTAKF